MKPYLALATILMLPLSCCPAAENAQPQKAGSKPSDVCPVEFEKARMIKSKIQSGFDPGSNNTSLLRKPAVEKELRLTVEQKQRLSESLLAFRPERAALWQENFPPLRTLDDSGLPLPFADVAAELSRRAKLSSKTSEERAKKLAEINLKELESIKAIMDVKQYNRFKQLQLQASLPYGILFNRAIADSLKLTLEQRSQISPICVSFGQATNPQAFRDFLKEDEELKRLPFQEQLKAKQDRVEKEFAETRRRGRMSPADRQIEDKVNYDRYRKLELESLAEILKLLTPEQKEAWDNLIGPPFEFGPS